MQKTTTLNKYHFQTTEDQDKETKILKKNRRGKNTWPIEEKVRIYPTSPQRQCSQEESGVKPLEC